MLPEDKVLSNTRPIQLHDGNRNWIKIECEEDHTAVALSGDGEVSTRRLLVLAEGMIGHGDSKDNIEPPQAQF